MEKAAFGLPSGMGESLSNIGGRISEGWKSIDPAAKAALVGSGVGGIAGLGSSMMSDDEDKHPMQSALTGALAGGAIGGGLGLAHKFNPWAAKESPAAKPELPDGQFKHPVTGKTMQFKPGMAPTPEQASKIEHATGGQAFSPESAKTAPADPQIRQWYSPRSSGTVAALGTAAGAHAASSRMSRTIAGASSQDPATLIKAFNAQGEKLPAFVESVLGRKVGTMENQAAVNLLTRIRANPDLLRSAAARSQLGPEGSTGQKLIEALFANQAATEAAAPKSMMSGLSRRIVGEPGLRESLLHKILPKLVKNPYVSTGTAKGALRTHGKWAIPAAIAGMGINYLGNRAETGAATQNIDQTLSQFAEPIPQ